MIATRKFNKVMARALRLRAQAERLSHACAEARVCDHKEVPSGVPPEVAAALKVLRAFEEQARDLHREAEKNLRALKIEQAEKA